MKIAVTGGTGFVGKAIVSELVKAGHKVRVLSRSIPEDLPEGVLHYPGSVVTGEGLGELVEDAGAVIHLVGIIKELGNNTFNAVHHQGTVNIILAASHAQVPRYLHMSAMGTREGGVSAYHRSKWKGEEAVRASGLNWTIFRPSTIYGPGDAFINFFAGTMRRSPIMPVIGGGHKYMQPVSVRDVAASFRSAVESSRHVERTYELGGADVLTLRHILEIVAHVIDKKPLFMPVPFQLARLAVKIAETLHISVPVTSDQLIMLGEDNVRTGGDPVEALGVRWTGFEEGIRTYLGPNREGGRGNR